MYSGQKETTNISCDYHVTVIPFAIAGWVIERRIDQVNGILEVDIQSQGTSKWVCCHN